MARSPAPATSAIKARYRELAHRYHADVNAGDGRAHARFRAVAAAYQKLVAPDVAPPPAADHAPATPTPDCTRFHNQAAFFDALCARVGVGVAAS